MLPSDIRNAVMDRVGEFSALVIRDAVVGDAKSMADHMLMFTDFICKGFEVSILEGKNIATKPSAN